MSSKITVILLQNISTLWNKGTLHQVSIPYFHNVLKPKWLAKIADSTTINNDTQKKLHDAKQAQARTQSIQQVFDTIVQKGNLTIVRQATQMQHLYDKIDARDIAQELLMQYKIKVDKNHLHIPHIIDMIWEYEVVFEWEWLKSKFIIDVIQK